MAQQNLMIQKLRPCHPKAYVLQQRLPVTGYHSCYSSEESENARSTATSVRFFQADMDLAAELPYSAVVSATSKNGSGMSSAHLQVPL